MEPNIHNTTYTTYSSNFNINNNNINLNNNNFIHNLNHNNNRNINQNNIPINNNNNNNNMNKLDTKTIFGIPPPPPTNNRLMVYVRVKPHDDQRSIVSIVDDETLIFDPIDAENQPADEYFYHGKKFKSIGSKRCKNSSYNFDKVFDEYSTNYKIYETVTRPMVDATINGLNCSVFAYGATGSGKTFTMLGNLTNPGVIYFTSKDLFGKLNVISETDPLPPELKICYFEIYNEKIRDLLVLEPTSYIKCGNKRLRTTPERSRARQQLVARDNFNLPVCEGPDGTSLVIPDLTYHNPENADELIKLLEAGNANRSQHPTDANADSSRSHAIFQIVLTRRTRQIDKSAFAPQYELQSSKMSLIDLAGSERASVAYRAGNDRSKNLQREGGNINKSLLALGNCINALADGKNNHKHIPYRNSKLTRLLRDSLGGKCRTAMIATVCQQPSHYDDTQNTLVYASRAKCIKLKPGRNFTNIAIQPKNYNLVIDTQNKQISTLQAENNALKVQLDQLKEQMSKIPTESVVVSTRFLDESQYRHDLEQYYEERAIIRMDALRYESRIRKTEMRQALKQLDLARHQVINGEIQSIDVDIQVPRMNCNSTVLIAHDEANKTYNCLADEERQLLQEKANMNDMRISDTIANMTTEFVMNGHGSAEDFDSVIEPYLHEKECEMEAEEKKFGEQHAYDIAQTGFDRLISTENLLLEAAHVVRYTHAITRGRGLSEPLEAKLSQLFRKLDGKKSVVWKDNASDYNDDQTQSQLSSVHDNFSLNFLTPFKNNNTLHSRKRSKNLVSFTNYTPEQSNATFDASQ